MKTLVVSAGLLLCAVAVAQNAPASQAGPPQQPADAVQPAQPTTEVLPEAKATPSADPLLEPKELPATPLSLIGGVVKKVDAIRNRIEVQPFGTGKQIQVRFDERSHIYREGRETTVLGIHRGDRIYVDTMSMDGHVFAKNLRVVIKSEAAEARGQLTGFNRDKGSVSMVDRLTGQYVSFDIKPSTVFLRDGQITTSADLKPGALVDVLFAPSGHGGGAQQITMLALPGEGFIFAGRVAHLDIRSGTMEIENESDENTYTVRFDSATLEQPGQLKVGSIVTARATFDGEGYVASKVSVTSPSTAKQ